MIASSDDVSHLADLECRGSPRGDRGITDFHLHVQPIARINASRASYSKAQTYSRRILRGEVNSDSTPNRQPESGSSPEKHVNLVRWMNIREERSQAGVVIVPALCLLFASVVLHPAFELLSEAPADVQS